MKIGFGKYLLVVLTLSSSLIATSASAQFTGAVEAIAFQGVLTDDKGIPIDAPQDIDVALWDSVTGGSQVWSRSYPAVPVNNGIFEVVLTASTPPLSEIPFDKPLWAEVTVDTETQSPRSQLGSVPYALGLRGVRVTPTEGNAYVNLIGGHHLNTADPGVNGATVGGGGGQLWPNRIVGHFGTVGGGVGNHAGQVATVPGGQFNEAGGVASFAAGHNARVRSPEDVGDDNGDEGTFVWSDIQVAGGTFQSTGPNQFLARAEGGFGFGTNDPQGYVHIIRDHDYPVSGAVELRLEEPTSGNSTLRFRNSGSSEWDVSANTNLLRFHHRDVGTGTGTVVMDLNVGAGAPPITTSAGAFLSAGGVWTDASSRSLKEDFQSVDTSEILRGVAELDVQKWRYRKEPGALHMGPVAEDFHALFGLGSDDRHIAALDVNGVALAAIQGLYAEVWQLKKENAELRRLIQRPTNQDRP